MYMLSHNVDHDCLMYRKYKMHTRKLAAKSSVMDRYPLLSQLRSINHVYQLNDYILKRVKSYFLGFK